jgi:ligand-binding sensor domain-containing protein
MRLLTLLPSPLAVLATLACLSPSAARPLDPTRSLSQYVHDRFTDRQGLPQNSVRAVMSSARGDLWIATDEGLARFDGTRFTVYDRRTAPALSSNQVACLAESPSGVLWIGTLEGGLYRLEAGRLEAAALPSPLPSPQVNALLDDGRGTLWIGTKDGLARLSAGKLSTFGAAAGLPHAEIRALALLRDGRLAVGTLEGVAVLEGGKVLPGPPELREVVVTDIAEDRAGTLWFATEGRGLARQPAAAGPVSFLGDAEGVPAALRAVHLDREGSLWLAGATGLLRLRGGHADRFAQRDGGESLRMLSVTEDREGNVWAGSEGGGLERLRDGDFVAVGREEGLAYDVTTGVLQDRRGDLWIGTLGGLSLAPAGDIERLRSIAPAGQPVGALAEDGLGTVWVGLLDGRLGRIRSGHLEVLTAPSSGRAVSALAVTPGGTVLAGTFHGLFQLEGGRLVPEGDPGLPAGVRVNALAFAPDGALWAGLEYRGAFRRPPGGRFERVDRGPPRGHDVNAFLMDPDGTVWMATLGDGLWRWRSGGGESLTTRQGLFNDVLWQILPDDSGRLWLSTNKGVFRVDRAEVEAVLDGRLPALTSTAFGVADGMRSRECNGGVQPAGWRTADGRLWFPTVKGLAVVDPARLHAPPNPPAIIDRAAVDGLAAEHPARLVLAPGTVRMTIDYTALSFSTPERLRFRYQLEGHDPAWIDPGEERAAVYTDLPPGRYRFVVQASAGAGAWGAPATLLIEQRPRLTQTWWFLPLVLAAALAAGVCIVAVRARRARARQVELQVRVREALAEVRRLEGLLPICGWCKKVRDDEGYWKGIEVYLSERGVADFTHGMCPDCLSRHYPEDETGS